MILIDTNLFISYRNEDDSKHKEALEIFKKISEGNFGEYIISDYIFDEIVTVCSLRKSHDEAISLGNFLLENVNILKVTERIFEISWEIFKKNINFSFTDCTNLGLMKEFGIKKIATFDKDFKKIKEIEVIDR